MSTEKISVNIPGQGFQILDFECRPSEGDDEIALRLARNFPEGTVLGIDGVKWRVVSRTPPKVVEVGQEPEPRPFEAMAAKVGVLPTTVLVAPPEPSGAPQPGERWKPKDPRRKSGFTIKAVTETEVLADDGRTVSLERMRRYEKIG